MNNERARSGRPKKGQRLLQKVHHHMDPKVVKKADRRARKMGISRAAYIQLCVMKDLEQ